MAKILKLDGAVATGRASQPAGRRVAGEVYEAAQRARDVLSVAEAEAQRIRSEAETERDRARAVAAEAGLQEGLAQATRFLARAALERDRLLASAEPELVRLALSIAERILRREVARETPVVEIASGALEEARERRVVLLRVHPEDASALRACQQRLAALLTRAPGIALREDPAVSRGGVVVETEGGTIDAQLDTQLETLRHVLEEATPV